MKKYSTHRSSVYTSEMFVSKLILILHEYYTKGGGHVHYVEGRTREMRRSILLFIMIIKEKTIAREIYFVFFFNCKF